MMFWLKSNIAIRHSQKQSNKLDVCIITFMKTHKNIIEQKELRDQINNKRNNRRIDLNREFQEFKHKIQELQNKHERVIENIHDKAQNFKKRNQEQADSYLTAEKPRIVYYEHRESNEAESEFSNSDETINALYEGYEGLPHRKSHASETIDHESIKPHHSSMRNNHAPSMRNNHAPSNQYAKRESTLPFTSPPSYEEPMQKQSTSFGYLPPHDLFPRDDLNARKYNQIQNISVSYMQQRHEQEIINLQALLQEQNIELEKLKVAENKSKSYSNHLKNMIEGHLQDFMEDGIKSTLEGIDKKVKKYQKKLKQLSFHLKDKIEQRKSSNLIKINQQRRNSRSKDKTKIKQKSQENSSISSVQPKQSLDKLTKLKSQETKSKHPSENIESKKKQFEEIANIYEAMVKQKQNQNQKLQSNLKEYSNEIASLTMETKKLKSALFEKQEIISELNQQINKQSKSIKKNSFESNLLDLDHSFHQNKIVFQEKYKETLQQLEAKLTHFEENNKRLQKQKKIAFQEYQESLEKVKLQKNQESENRSIVFEKQLQAKGQQIIRLKQKETELEKKLLEKQCDKFVFQSKLKKLENDQQLSNQKIQELEKLLHRDHFGSAEDSLNRSLSIDQTMILPANVNELKQNIKFLDEGLEEKKILIFGLEKQILLIESQLKLSEEENKKLSTQNKELLEKISRISNENTGKLSSKKYLEKDESSDEDEKNHLMTDNRLLEKKNSEMTQQSKSLKDEILSINTLLIKIKGENKFLEESLSDLEGKLICEREECERLKEDISKKDLALKNEKEQHDEEIKIQLEMIKQLESDLFEFQSHRKESNEDQINLLSSSHNSDLSFHFAKNKTIHDQQTQVFTEKIKELHNALELKDNIEQQMERQYRDNLNQLKQELACKSQQISKITHEHEDLKQEVKKQKRSEGKNIKREERENEELEQYFIEKYEMKIHHLEKDLELSNESQVKMNEVLHEMFEKIQNVQQQNAQLIRENEEKIKINEELKDLLELKDVKLSNKSLKDQKQKVKESHFSLRYSMDSKDQKEIEEEHSQVCEMSYLSNISEIFKKDDVLQNKIKKGKSSREEQIKLFAKTSAYIKSLKLIIENKDKRIKTIEKQLLTLKAQPQRDLVWNLPKKTEDMEYFHTEVVHFDHSFESQYKDYDSVQFDERGPKYFEKVKRITRDKELAIEENKMLIHQIQLLQEELEKAEEQEDSLVKIKDLYKEEIKNTIERHQIRAKEFESEIDRLQNLVDESQFNQNIDAMRQLFIKMVYSIVYLEDEQNKGKRKEEKKKELAQYVKIMCSLLRMESHLKDKLIASVHQRSKQ